MTHYFDKLAQSWDERYQRSRLFRARYRQFERAVTQYGSGSQRALDYGCGSGVLTAILEQVSESVVAADLSEKMLNIARSKYADSPNVEVSNIEGLPESRFDLAICSSVIEYVDDPDHFMATLSGYLRPGGRLLMTFPNRIGPLQLFSRTILSLFKSDPYTGIQRNIYSRRTILDLIKKHKLEYIELTTPIGLPVLTALGMGELYFLVAEKKT